MWFTVITVISSYGDNVSQAIRSNTSVPVEQRKRNEATSLPLPLPLPFNFFSNSAEQRERSAESWEWPDANVCDAESWERDCTAVTRRRRRRQRAMTLFLFRRLPDSRSCCCYALVFCIRIIFAALLTYRCDGKKNIYIYRTSSLLALRTFNCKFQLFNSAFNAFFSAFCVAFSQLRVLHATSSLKRLSLVASALFSGQRLPAVCGSSQATAQLICSTGLWRRRLFSRHTHTHTHSHGWLADCFVIVAGAAAANA